MVSMEKYEVNFSIDTIFYKSCLGERWDLALKEKRLLNVTTRVVTFTGVTQLERMSTCRTDKIGHFGSSI
jgi:hypothetical protein